MGPVAGFGQTVVARSSLTCVAYGLMLGKVQIGCEIGRVYSGYNRRWRMAVAVARPSSGRFV